MKLRLGIAGVCAAATGLCHAGWSPSGEVTSTYTSGSFTLVGHSGEIHNPSGCANVARYGLDVSAENYKGILATLLSAQLAGRSVRFYVSGCGGQSAAHPKIISVEMF